MSSSTFPPIIVEDPASHFEAIHPPKSAHTCSPPHPSRLPPQAVCAIPPIPDYGGVCRHAPRNDSGLDSNGGKPGAAKRGREVSVASHTTTIPDESQSQLSPTPTGTPPAATRISDPGKTKSHGESEDAILHDGDPTADPTPFKHKALVLASLVDPKCLQSLEAMGGTEGLLHGLGTDAHLGLRSWQHTNSGQGDVEKGEGGGAGAGGDSPQSRATADDRRRIYGVNERPCRKSKGLLLRMWLNLKEKKLKFLSVAAVVELVVGLHCSSGTSPEKATCNDVTNECATPPVDWVEGVAIMIAILCIIIVGSFSDWKKQRQLCKLNSKKEDRGVKVVRDGKKRVINVKDVMVGDVALLEPGEIIPCDGVFLGGHNVCCDESDVSGESDAIKKVTYEECIAETKDLEPGETPKLDCFIISGTKVVEGVGQYVVAAVGPRTFHGRIMAALSRGTECTLLQLRLEALAKLIEKLGYAVTITLLIGLMIKIFVQSKSELYQTASEKAVAVLRVLVICATLTVVAVPEGLPLAVNLALTLATKRMTRDGLLVRNLSSCETMANASVICTDKTGTLTQNVMSAVAGSVGIHCKFVQHLPENKGRQNVGRVVEDQDVNSEHNRRHKDDFSLEMSELNTVIHEPLRSLFNEALAVNSTAFEDENPETGELGFVGSQTEIALLRFAKDLKWGPYQQTRSNAEIVQMIPFSSDRKFMGVIVRVSDNKYRFYLKGASEVVTQLCTRHVLVHPASETRADSEEVETAPITELEQENTSRTISFYTNQMLRTLAIAYREIESWPPASHTGAIDEVPYEMIANELTLIGIVAIEDPLRPGVKDAVAKCRGAGVGVKMCTGDNLSTARSIASQCGILTHSGIAMEGHVFRGLSSLERREIVPRLQVLARSSPEDKRILVDTLKSLGETVAVTGDGANDGPALKHAHVGFSVGIAGTEIAKEASDIMLMGDDFASIVSAIMWGRCVNDSIRKFLQFHISVNIAAVLTTFIPALASDKQASLFAPVQLLWINIIMDTFAALSLATDPASPELLKRIPDRKAGSLFSADMAKMIIGQSLYQTTIILLLHLGGPKYWAHHIEVEVSTMVFNTFVFCQIFNLVNCRSLTQDKNIFRGLTKNWYFIAIISTVVVIQILIVFFGGAAFQVAPMNGRDWVMSIALGFISIPLGFLIRCIPTPPAERFFFALRIMRGPRADERRMEPANQQGLGVNPAVFRHLRGRRMHVVAAPCFSSTRLDERHGSASPRVQSVKVLFA